MSLFLTISCFIIAFIAYRQNKALHNPITLYLGVWAFVFALYTMNPYGLPQIQDATYNIYTVGFVSFLLGNAFVRKRPRLKEYSNNPQTIREKFLSFFIIVMLILMLIPALKSMGLLLSGADLHDIRYVHHDDILGDGIVAIAFVYFCEPFITFLIIYSVINMFIGQRKLFYILLSIVSLCLMTVITGGRFFVLYFIASLLIALFIFRRSPVAKKITKYSVLLLGLLVLVLVVISIVRGSDITRTMYVYLSGSIPFMEERLSANANYLPNMFGLASLNGLIRPIFVVLRKIFSMDLPLPLQIVESVFLEDDAMVMLTPEIHYNSFVSIFYSMYLDGGLFGVALGNCILGIMAKSIYVRLKENDTYTLVLYTLVSIIFLLSFFKFLVCNYSYALSFVYLYICFTYKRHKVSKS